MDWTVGIESKVGFGTKIWTKINFEYATSTESGKIISTLSSSQSDPSGEFTGSRDSMPDEKDEQRRFRVLVAEDNIVNQKVLMRMLSRLGYFDVDLVDNGQKAVTAVETSWATGAEYSVVLMDCMMPVMTGYQACAAIRELEMERSNTVDRIKTGTWDSKNSRLKIVALTANASVQDMEECYTKGMDKYCTKPITLKGLKKLLDEFY